LACDPPDRPNPSRYLGYSDRAHGIHHVDPRSQGALRQTSGHRPLDLAPVDVRFGDRSDRLFHAVPVVPAQLGNYL
jgi:hypothetical protein